MSFSLSSRFPNTRKATTPGPGTDSQVIPGTFERRPVIEQRQMSFSFGSDDDSFGRVTPDRSSSDSSVRGEELRTAGEEFIEAHAGSRMTATDIHLSGTVIQGRTELFRLIDNHDIVVVGEGSHEENATTQILCHPENTPAFLKAHGVGTIYVEHLYPSHIAALQGDHAGAERHLNSRTFMRLEEAQSPAHQLCDFLRACLDGGIQIISIESPDIYIHYQADRVPNLNTQAFGIMSKQDHSQAGNKALVYIGAAHTNSHNDTDTIRKTPGLTEVLPRATEMLIVAGRPENFHGIHSVGDGYIFGITA